MLRARESVSLQFLQFQPQVSLNKLSDAEIVRLNNSWSFLDDFNVLETISFRGEILAQKTALDGKKLRVFVRWLPMGVLKDSWMDESELPKNGMITINVQSMTWEQKLQVRDKLFMRR